MLYRRVGTAGWVRYAWLQLSNFHPLASRDLNLCFSLLQQTLAVHDCECVIIKYAILRKCAYPITKPPHNSPTLRYIEQNSGN